jgi:hypothetical protein
MFQGRFWNVVDVPSIESPYFPEQFHTMPPTGRISHRNGLIEIVVLYCTNGQGTPSQPASPPDTRLRSGRKHNPFSQVQEPLLHTSRANSAQLAEPLHSTQYAAPPSGMEQVCIPEHCLLDSQNWFEMHWY